MKPPQERIFEIDWKSADAPTEIGVGDIVRCRFHRHGSVGEDAEFEIANDSILVHEDTKAEYVNPEHMKKAGWTGGDAERVYWDFRATARGETTLTIRILFRFDVESEHVVRIRVA